MSVRTGEPVIDEPRVHRGGSALRVWLPVVLWTAIIVLESTAGSSGNTGAVLLWFARKLFHNIDPAAFASFHHVLRKAAHFIGYGILGVLWFRAFRMLLWSPHNENRLVSRTRAVPVALAVFATFATACLDEWHQSFSSARTGQFSDVLLDTAGAVVLLSIAIVVERGRMRAR